MDLADQLKNLFPDHEPLPEEKVEEVPHELYVQKEPMICKFEKRKGKATTIIIQGDYRDKIMEILKLKGFKVKRVGG